MQRYVGQDVPRTNKQLIDSQLQNNIQFAPSTEPAHFPSLLEFL